MGPFTQVQRDSELKFLSNLGNLNTRTFKHFISNQTLIGRLETTEFQRDIYGFQNKNPGCTVPLESKT